MEAKPGRLVKAVYDFPTDDPEELPLLVGDIVQIKERIDKQWSRGVCNGREGNFPIGFTVDLKTPQLAENQQLFAVTNDFMAQEDGDLTLQKGDLVIGNSPLDSNWWKGEKDGITGIFPITHVWKVDKSILPVASGSKKIFAKAKVKMSITAQLPEEMDLNKDEIVNVLEEVEKGWFRGECNGRHGIFPASFVTILPDSSVDESSLPSAENPPSNITHTYGNKYGYDCINSGITAYGVALYPFQAEYADELSLKEGEIVNLIRHVDNNWIEGEIDGKTGIFPANFVNIIVDCPKSDKLSENSDSACEADANTFPPDTYGRVTCDFDPQLEGGAKLKEGDTVTLIRKLDCNFYEVETDNGEASVCPESYIEVIGSGPPSYAEVMASIGGASSLIDSSFSDHAKHSKSGRPLSFASSTSDSSFSSQSSANDKISSQGAFKILDDKTANLTGLNSSVLSSDTSFSDKSSRSIYSNFDTSGSQGIDAFNSSNDSSPRHCGFNLSFSPKYGDSRNQTNLTTIPALVKTPLRPPPPANMSLSRNTSVANNSFNSSASSTRLSISSVSSYSSSDISSDCFNETEIQNQIHMKEQVLKQRTNCLNKLENEVRNITNSSVSSEMRTQISQIKDDIERLKKEIEYLKAKLKPDTGQVVMDQSSMDLSQTATEQSSISLNQTTTEQNNIEDVRLRDEEVIRKRELENKRREQERKNKMKEQRECIITELLQSERDYVSDLKLLHNTFMGRPEEAKSKGINVIALFGNLDEVINLADRLLKRLDKSSRSNHLIGECFVDMSDEMKEVYGHYCRNHDEVTSVLDKIEFQSPAGQFINHKLEILKRQTNCFDLGAMLIKPVQRILKYPLLLDQLLKCTEDEHPDKPGLKQSIIKMSDVATAINEFKRQKDLVFKYRKQSDTSFSGRISKFNFHSVAKKSSRFGMRISTTIGLKSGIVDEEFEKVSKKFKAIEKSLVIFTKDLNEFTKKSEELYTCTFNMADGIAELYGERKSQQEVDQFRAAHNTILTQYWESFKNTIDRSIHSPIKQLLQAYAGPKNLIMKREDKLMDYLSSTSKLEKNKDVTKAKMLQETQLMDKNNYEALNSQLLNDLPRLCDLSIEILCDCIRCFLKSKKTFIGRTARLMLGLMDLPLMLGNKGTDILETFQVKHNLVMDDLSRLSIAFKQFHSCIKPTDTSKKNPSPKGSRLSFGTIAATVKFQTSNQRTKVKSTYPQSVLYTACENFAAVDLMDISLKKGDVVGVIKQQDPMGNKTRWFVDTGDAQGFVPAKCLMKFLPDVSSAWGSTSATSASSKAATSGTPQDFHQFYAKPTNQAQKKQNGLIQPSRPAPPVTSSLRMVQPSRYPPPSHASTPKPRASTPLSNSRTVPNTSNTNSCMSGNFPSISTNINSNYNTVSTEPVHRYEEIPDSSNIGQNNSLMLLSDTAITQNSTSNLLDEFDPYSSSVVPQVYDNVPDNLNSMYSSHRYEDIPEDLYYDEVPTEATGSESDEYYYGLYDFVPTGPNQVSLKKGQVVLVLHKCDLNQNSEWWFVEDRHGNKGYVPALYLNKYSKDIA